MRASPQAGCGTGASRFAPLGLAAIAAVAAIAASWQCWINPFIDSGREMDVPWRLLQGERLYRDITYYYGPLGPWANTLALRLFGHRWLSLELVCGALSALIFLLLFRLTRRAGGPVSATAATTLAAAVCMAAPRGGGFLFPYSSSNLFALAGALLALSCAAEADSERHDRHDRRLGLGALGIAVALSSRLEIGMAAAAALTLTGLRSRRREETVGDLGVVAFGSLLACGAYAVACLGIPWARLLADGPFGPFLGMPREWKYLYLKAAGLAEPGDAAGRMGASLLLDGLLVAA
ncbi:MAG TPA: glycosyltransferase family 39 protein, partial [Thermoanaerobaculia bacterium]|nr:glycosyltransferase family 39 protein [Thermoanaerobaculia bacterium]